MTIIDEPVITRYQLTTFLADFDIFVCSEHATDVRRIVEQAVMELSIERHLKTYEEVWLSKVFELGEHHRNTPVMDKSVLPSSDTTATSIQQVIF